MCSVFFHNLLFQCDCGGAFGDKTYQHEPYGFSLCLFKTVLGTVIVDCFLAVEVIHHSHSLTWSLCFGKSLERVGFKAYNPQKAKADRYTSLVLELSSRVVLSGSCSKLRECAISSELNWRMSYSPFWLFWRDKQSIIMRAFQV